MLSRKEDVGDLRALQRDRDVLRSRLPALRLGSALLRLPRVRGDRVLRVDSVPVRAPRYRTVRSSARWEAEGGFPVTVLDDVRCRNDMFVCLRRRSFSRLIYVWHRGWFHDARRRERSSTNTATTGSYWRARRPSEDTDRRRILKSELMVADLSVLSGRRVSIRKKAGYSRPLDCPSGRTSRAFRPKRRDGVS